MKTYIHWKRDNDFFTVEFPAGEAFGTVELPGEVFTAYIGRVEAETVNGKQKKKITIIEV